MIVLFVSSANSNYKVHKTPIPICGKKEAKVTYKMMMAFTAVKKTVLNVKLWEKNQCEEKSMVNKDDYLVLLTTSLIQKCWSTLLYFFQEHFQTNSFLYLQTFPYQLFPSAHPLAYTLLLNSPSPGVVPAGSFSHQHFSSYGFLNLSNFWGNYNH